MGGLRALLSVGDELCSLTTKRKPVSRMKRVKMFVGIATDVASPTLQPKRLSFGTIGSLVQKRFAARRASLYSRTTRIVVSSFSHRIVQALS